MGLKLARQDDVEWDGNASLQLKQRSTRFPHFRPHTLSPYPESRAGLEAVGLYFLFRLPQHGGLQGLFQDLVDEYRGLKNYLYCFGGSLVYLEYNGPLNPILITKPAVL